MKTQFIKPEISLNDLTKYLTENNEIIEIKNDKVIIPIEKYLQSKMPDTPEPYILFSTKAFMRMMLLIERESRELAWHGTVTRNKEKNYYLIDDIYVYPQIATSATVDADEKKYTQWLMDNKELLPRLRMQGHSHVNMGTTPSSTDEGYYKEMLEQFNDFYIFIIVNKQWKMHIRLYDKETNILYSDLPYYIWNETENLDLETFHKESEKQIQTKTYPTKTYTYPINEEDPVETYRNYIGGNYKYGHK